MAEGNQLTIAGRAWRYFRQLDKGKQPKARADAYKRVFRTGGASEQDRQCVLTDLATVSGFYRVTPPGAGANVAYHAGMQDGQRAIFAHIYSRLRLTADERAALEAAAQADYQKLTG
jgi:hypothetical protein